MNFQNSNFIIIRNNIVSTVQDNRKFQDNYNRDFRFDKQFFQRLTISYATEKYLLQFTLVSLCKHAN